MTEPLTQMTLPNYMEPLRKGTVGHIGLLNVNYLERHGVKVVYISLLLESRTEYNNNLPSALDYKRLTNPE